MKQPVFRGVCTALVTPFENGTVDKHKLEQLIDLQADAGIDALVVCGTTGESPTLSTSEKIEIIAHTIQYTAGRMKVIAGTGCNDTAHTLELSRVASSAGADGILVVTPYYNKTTQAGLIDHFTTIADQVTCPVIVYNVPSRTGLDISVKTYAALSKHPNINGVKDACGDISKVQRTLNVCGDDFFVWSGNDDQIVPVMSVGGSGVISVLSNILPVETARLAELCRLQDYKSAGRLQCHLMPLIDCLFEEVNPIPVKTAMNLLGYDVGRLRRPLLEMSERGTEHMKVLLEEFAVPKPEQ